MTSRGAGRWDDHTPHSCSSIKTWYQIPCTCFLYLPSQSELSVQIQLRWWEEGHSSTRCPQLPEGASTVVDPLFTPRQSRLVTVCSWCSDDCFYLACSVHTVSGDHRSPEEANFRRVALGTQRGLSIKSKISRFHSRSTRWLISLLFLCCGRCWAVWSTCTMTWGWWRNSTWTLSHSNAGW